MRFRSYQGLSLYLAHKPLVRVLLMNYPIDARLEHDIRYAEDPGGQPVLTAYKDSLGYWTIGTGHLLQPQGHDWSGYTITAEQAEIYLSADLMQAEHLAQRLPEWNACDTDCRRNALIEICFNMGGRWLEFHEARAAWVKQEWDTAAADMLDSLWARQVGQRAVRLADYVRTGQYPA